MSDPTSPSTPPPDPMARLEQALREVGSDASPPRGWESRVRAAVAETAPKRRWWRIALPSLGGLTAVAAGLVLWLGRAPHVARTVFAVDMSIKSRAQPDLAMMSKDDFRQHDVVTLRATGDGGNRREMRVYVDRKQLVLQCAPPCELTLRVLDEYSVLALASDRELPAPTNDLDADLQAARAAGAQTALEQFRVE